MLVEVIAAIAVVAVGLTAFASGIPVAAMAVSEGAQHSTATFLAAARLEEIRGAEWRVAPAFDRLGLSTGPLSAPQINGTITFPDETALANPYARYARRVRIADCGLLPGCGAVTSPLLRLVTVTVTYRPVAASGLAASDKSVSLTTLIAQR